MLLGAVVLAGIMAGCAKDEMKEISNTFTYSSAEDSNKPYTDQVVEMLKSVEGISDVTAQYIDDEKHIAYIFNVEQPVSHFYNTGYTFKQRCALQYVDPDAPVVFHTSGYGLYSDGQLPNIELGQYLNANILHMEHRYWGTSQPQSLNNIDFTYLWTNEAAADMHSLVALLKKNVFTGDNQWVSTGLSKGGITSALYAYYSDMYGWDDMDLYVPFGAPFLEGTDVSCQDKAVGTYLLNNCGAGYAAGTDEYKAYQYLCQYPNVIADNKAVRDACLRMFSQEKTEDYLAAQRTYPDELEKAATAMIIDVFYENLLEKFAAYDFSKWASLVPNPADAYKADATDDEINGVASFAFIDAKALGLAIILDDLSKNMDNDGDGGDDDGDADGDDDDDLFGKTRSAYTEEDMYNWRASGNVLMPYHIQSMRELGSYSFDFSALTSSYITAQYAAEVSANLSETEGMYSGVYKNQWDGGKLMKSFKTWLHTTQKHLVFVYCSNDPWTGGAIEDINDNTNIMKLVVPGGRHSDHFLTEFDKASSATLQGMISAYIKH